MKTKHVNDLSEGALESRRKYYRDYYDKNKANRRKYTSKYWEDQIKKEDNKEHY